ncbi:MAG: helix-turn-helix domain-containing protein [Candidatus Nanopelagicales bacterium]|nr:helix-turn-helix domain-containing protein [Candidatus Nanopelagicales bacterium]
MPNAANNDLGVHRLLAGESRATLLDLLRQSDHPMTVSELASASGLHDNTVRGHLDLLVSAGFITRRKERRATPGRPRIGYSVTVSGSFPSQQSKEEGDSLRLLCRVLAAQAAHPETAGTAWVRARTAAEQWMREHDDVDPARTVDTPEEALTVISEILDERGFAPEIARDQHSVVLHACPYGDLAMEQQQVVCGVHLGLLLGNLERMNSPVGARFSEIDPTTPRCVVQLVERPNRTEDSP